MKKVNEQQNGYHCLYCKLQMVQCQRVDSQSGEGKLKPKFLQINHSKLS